METDADPQDNEPQANDRATGFDAIPEVGTAAEGLFAGLEHPIVFVAVPLVALGGLVTYLWKRRRRSSAQTPSTAWDP